MSDAVGCTLAALLLVGLLLFLRWTRKSWGAALLALTLEFGLVALALWGLVTLLEG